MLHVLVLIALAAAEPLPSGPTELGASAAREASAINAVMGDLSAFLGYVDVPSDVGGEPLETARIRGHLEMVHDVLAAVDTRAWPLPLRSARARNLERLRAYAAASEFPRNDDHPDARRPTFVDDRGAICAVGALFAADRGRAEAERIARVHKYDYVLDIDDPALAAWQATSGLSTGELAMIQPAYRRMPSEQQQRNWRGGDDGDGSDAQETATHGLLDRAQLSPSKLVIASELGTADRFDTLRSTLHGQLTFDCGCHFGFFATLPITIPLAAQDGPGALAAGQPLPGRERSAHAGTLELGGFIGGTERRAMELLRVGLLLPTAPRDPWPTFQGARVGDVVLDLPRTFGARLSWSQLTPWSEQTAMSGTQFAGRFDVGFDWAMTASGDTRPRAHHVIPRAGAGVLAAREILTVSLDSVVAYAPDFDGDDERDLRWSTGVTVRPVRRGRPSMFQPSISAAAVRTGGGWGATFGLELVATKTGRH